MNWEKWKSRAGAAIPLVLGFLSAAVALPHAVEWLMPSCIHTRIGCAGEPVLLVLLIKAGLGVLVIGTFYLAIKYAPRMAGRGSS